MHPNDDFLSAPELDYDGFEMQCARIGDGLLLLAKPTSSPVRCARGASSDSLLWISPATLPALSGQNWTFALMTWSIIATPLRLRATRQYARLLSDWLASVGLDPHLFGTHSLRRTKATLTYRRTGNLRAEQLFGSHENRQHRSISGNRAPRRATQ